MSDIEFTPEELLQTFPKDWIDTVNEYQKHRWEHKDIQSFIDVPLPFAANGNETRLGEMAEENRGIYDAELEDKLEEDVVLSGLYAVHKTYHTVEGYAQAVRVRRTVAAYVLFVTAKDHTIAS